MKVFEVRNVNKAVAEALPWLVSNGIPEDSRNGVVLVAPGPVTTVYANPMERVLFSPVRDANPFFHLMESIWMLAGRNDIKFPKEFNSRFGEYSDDGVTGHGVYGYRWRNFFNFDQLGILVEELRANPNTRRCVLTMWSPDADLSGVMDPSGKMHGGMKCKDVPCNTQAYFDVRGGALNMTVCNRSNDVVWGAYGANAVHLSILQEYMAGWLNVPVGVYRQMSNNFHVYTNIYNQEQLMAIAIDAQSTDFYGHRKQDVPEQVAKPYLIFTGNPSIEQLNEDLINFFTAYDDEKLDKQLFYTSFFNLIIMPMYLAYMERKTKTGSGQGHINMMPDCDWKLACTTWIARKELKN